MKKLLIVLFSFFLFFTVLNANEFTATLELRIHNLVNAERVKYGFKPLKRNNKLAEIARAHSLDMCVRDYFNHIDPDGLSPTDRSKKAGFKTTIKRKNYTREGVGENIFASQAYMESDGVKTPEMEKMEVVAQKAITGWMNSPGHRKNILDPDYTQEGTGVAVSKDKKVNITQNFF